VLSNVISSQVALHQKYGGVVPEIASRKHVELIMPVIHQSLEEAGIKIEQVDAIGVTTARLVGAFWSDFRRLKPWHLPWTNPLSEYIILKGT